MTTMWGADAEALDAAARAMTTAADRLVAIRSSVNHLLGVVRWGGPDGAAFRSEWERRLQPRLLHAHDALSSAASSLHANARQQRDTSAASTGHISMVAAGGTHAAVLGLPAGHHLAAVGHADMLLDGSHSFGGGLMARIQDVPSGSFEILRLDTEPPRYIVNLPGITFGAHDLWDNASLRDLHAAADARLGGASADAYASRVMAEMHRAGIPSGAQVMLVGHSYGAIAAMHLASDHGFNRPDPPDDGGYHVDVTHVLAAGAGVRDQWNDAPEGTKVMIAVNRQDFVAGGIEVTDGRRASLLQNGLGVVRNVQGFVDWRVGHAIDAESQEVTPGRVIYDFSVSNFHGHDLVNYERGLDAANGAADAWMDDAMRNYFVGVQNVAATLVEVPDVPPASAGLGIAGGGGGGAGW